MLGVDPEGFTRSTGSTWGGKGKSLYVDVEVYLLVCDWSMNGSIALANTCIVTPILCPIIDIPQRSSTLKEDGKPSG